MKEIAGALKAKKWSVALDKLLVEWRTRREPEVAALIDRVSALAGEKPMLALDGLKYADALKRITALEKRPADPRIAAALVGLVLAPPFTAQSSRAAWGSILDQLEDRHADPRTLAALAPQVATYQKIFGATKMGESMQKRIGALVKKLRARWPSPPRADVAALAKLVPAPKAKAARVKAADPLQAVWDDPDADAPRLVAADWFLEKNDPRGEFITLQFQKVRDLRREQALLAKHAKEWLGLLHPVLLKSRTRFERGFLHACTIKPVGKHTALALGRPEWSTVRDLSIYRQVDDHIPIVKQLRGVERLTQVDPATFRAIAGDGADRALRTLGLSYEFFDDEANWKLLLSAVFPKLRELRIEYPRDGGLAAYDDLWEGPLGQQLEKVIIGYHADLDSMRLAHQASSPKRAIGYSMHGYEVLFAGDSVAIVHDPDETEYPGGATAIADALAPLKLPIRLGASVMDPAFAKLRRV